MGSETSIRDSGRIQQDRWENANGDKRSRVYIQADEVAPSLRWAIASVTKTSRGSGESETAEPEVAPVEEPAAAPAKRTRRTAKAG